MYKGLLLNCGFHHDVYIVNLKWFLMIDAMHSLVSHHVEAPGFGEHLNQVVAVDGSVHHQVVTCRP